MAVEHDETEVRSMGPQERRLFDEQVRQRVIRFGDLIPDWASYPDTQLPEYARGLRMLIGGGSEKARPDGIRVESENFTLAIIEADPGCGAALHAHTTEEMFMPLKGEWLVYWGPDDDGVPQYEVTLCTWDAVSIPGPVMRGFKNASGERGFLLIATGGPQELCLPPARLACLRLDNFAVDVVIETLAALLCSTFACTPCRFGFSIIRI